MAEAHVEECEEGPSQSLLIPSGSTSSERKKKSAIWAFYSVSPNDSSKAVCHTCKEQVSRGGKTSRSFNTTNLRKHLEIHPDKYKEFCTVEEESAKEKSIGKRQLTLETTLLLIAVNCCYSGHGLLFTT
uniref:BED-type domain-containing protein n=1 Tax=Amphimedon queenslandica TaxID=400682 RepID=A0A1X7UC61_AMPQE